MKNQELILKKYFGYDKFREGQEKIIDNIVSKKDSVGIMPTGAGKSICFWVPALMFDGITIVISPLISLMKDQVNSLNQAGIRAAYINSSLTQKQIETALYNAQKGVYKIIYIAPERLLTDEFINVTKSIKVSMLAVDEAHCISSWGQDFRPSYRRIPEFLNTFEEKPLICAFTATATKAVQTDIVKLLELNDPFVLVTGFDRTNLSLSVKTPKNKTGALLSFLEDKKNLNGIIYASTRANVELICDELNRNGYNASRYHAGLTDSERHENQDKFLYDQVSIMVATNAFGMGIDKSNVSFVVHYNMPKDLESYYQEAGRAGRDGQDAKCILFYSKQDVRTNQWLIENSNTSEQMDQQTRDFIKECERNRLRDMTFYCTTTDCLRSYILKYFGEKPPNYCGNCSNCNTNFETKDVTLTAQKILSCVARMNGRFGVNIIINVLKGSKNERILKLGLDKLSVYGICNEPEKILRDIIDHLLLNDYIVKTNDEYPTVSLCEKANNVLYKEEKISMKLSKEEKLEKPITKTNSRPSPNDFDSDLLNELKLLRLKLAQKQKVPAYVIFTDSTLVDMCMKKPVTKENLLEVSGIGQVKATKYGDEFITLILNHTVNNKAKVSNENKVISENKENKAAGILITAELVGVSIIADRINCYTLQNGFPKISAQKISDLLVSKGYLEIVKTGEKTSEKVPTEKGKISGITRVKRVMTSGRECFVNVFEERMQEIVIKIVNEEFLQKEEE